MTLQDDLQRLIAQHVFPSTVAEQRDMTVLLGYFVDTVARYDNFASLYRLSLVRQQKNFWAMDDFPQTDTVLENLRRLKRKAETYRDMLSQHLQATQMAHDLQDLDSLTKHRIYRVL